MGHTSWNKGKKTGPRPDLMGSGNPHYGKPPSHAKRIPYKDVVLRSTFELRFAIALDAKGIEWEYEKHTFELGGTTYTPDFKIKGTNVFYEVKGWYKENSLYKSLTFRKLYPEYTLIIIMLPTIKQWEKLAS